MKKIHVALGAHAYDIEIAAGLLPQVGSKVAALLPKARKAAIISDTNVAPLYAAKLQASLEEAGLVVHKVVIEAGEQSKNMQVLSDVLEQLAAAGLTRTDVVLTLGGGVVGDLGGFAAASFMRGIAFVQIPTSLLAQIDSSVGGKVAVDLKAGKNLAGAFYQPKAVFIDTDLLATLSTRFLHDGLAEAIKYGCIKDAALFAKIAGYADDAALLADIDSVVATCCAIKARIVEQDEFDTGLRMLLKPDQPMPADAALRQRRQERARARAAAETTARPPPTGPGWARLSVGINKAMGGGCVAAAYKLTTAHAPASAPR